MNILIMGPAGSGKGTAAKKIVEEFLVAHISTGDMLRENVKENTDLGQQAKDYMEAGRLVPDDLINAMVKERLLRDDVKEGYLMDGFPRTLVQAKAFDEITKSIEKPVEVVINLKVDVDTLAGRITGRRICKNCGAIYHIKNAPSKVEGICDVCGNPTIQRPDDTLEQLQVRLSEHAKNTEPVLDYYREKGLVKDIEAAKSADEVWLDIKQAIDTVK
ncbi:MAG TPA: adenylate kinase [Erysipelotrichaceae bacterium]|jgi:adenylate kinase|nr:adenylate kinase [Bacillota bacterium]HCY05772.1 adenylate kinase [Erysipelotrichaceae bacterium]